MITTVEEALRCNYGDLHAHLRSIPECYVDVHAAALVALILATL